MAEKKQKKKAAPPAAKVKKKAERSSFFSTILRIIKDAKPLAPRIFFASVVSLLAILLSTYAPRLVGSLTDRIVAMAKEGAESLSWDPKAFARDVLILAGVYLLSAAASLYTSAMLSRSVSRHYTCRIRTEMSAKISRLPFSYIDKTPNGEIISRMTDDVSTMGNSVHTIFNTVIGGALKLIIVTVTIFLESPPMALSVVVLVPLSLFVSSKLATRSEKHFADCRELSGKIYAKVEEDLTGFDTVKAFHLEDRQQKDYADLVVRHAKKLEKGFFASGIVQPTVALMNRLSYIAVCLIGGLLAINPESGVSVGSIVAFILYTSLFSAPLETIANGLSSMQSTAAAAKRVYEFLDYGEMSELPSRDLPPAKGAVRFENVCFSYDPKTPLIENFSLDVKPGQKIAVVGPTGGGKTTIVNLLLRFYDPDSGTILIDGSDTKTLSRDDVRKNIALVLQDTWLFSGSVADNIAYGREDASRESIENAARHACIDGFIESLPQGYDTKISEGSGNISAGQKQLFTIARAYLADRPILVLDEATSNVDTRTEILIQKTMDELMHGRTAFVIAHRLSTIVNADRIIVIDHGHIQEVGTHEELLKNGGLYSEIFRSQYASLSENANICCQNI